jgi:hypothetical protein
MQSGGECGEWSVSLPVVAYQYTVHRRIITYLTEPPPGASPLLVDASMLPLLGLEAERSYRMRHLLLLVPPLLPKTDALRIRLSYLPVGPIVDNLRKEQR